MMRMRAAFLSFALLFLGDKAALAYGIPHADLACAPQKDIALARFAETGDEAEKPAFEQLPASLDAGLSKQVETGRRDCKLANGWRIRLRNGRGQAYAYGAGGGAPGSFFSLWIEGRKIISHRLWTDYDRAEERAPITSVIVSPSALTICEGAGQTRACKVHALRLGALPIDETEYPNKIITAKAPPRNRLVITGKDQKLCRILVKRGPDERGTVRTWEAPQVEPDLPAPNESSLEWIDESLLERVELGWDHIANAGKAFGIKFDNFVSLYTMQNPRFSKDGKGVAVRRESSNRYFDGSFIVVAPEGTSVIDVLRGLYGDGPDTDEEEAVQRASARGWAVYAGGMPGIYPDKSPRYVSVRPWGKALYFRALDRSAKPTAQIMTVGADGKPVMACAIQRPLLHY